MAGRYVAGPWTCPICGLRRGECWADPPPPTYPAPELETPACPDPPHGLRVVTAGNRLQPERWNWRWRRFVLKLVPALRRFAETQARTIQDWKDQSQDQRYGGNRRNETVCGGNQHHVKVYGGNRQNEKGYGGNRQNESGYGGNRHDENRYGENIPNENGYAGNRHNVTAYGKNAIRREPTE